MTLRQAITLRRRSPCQRRKDGGTKCRHKKKGGPEGPPSSGVKLLVRYLGMNIELDVLVFIYIWQDLQELFEMLAV